MMAEIVVQEAPRPFGEGRFFGPEANSARLLGAEAGFDGCHRAMQFHGGYSCATEQHVERFWREARLPRTALIWRPAVVDFIPTKGLGLPQSSW